MQDDDIQYALLDLRARLGLTRHAMAELLYTHQQTYQGWEEGARPRGPARERIIRFVESATKQLDQLEANGQGFLNLMPLNIAAASLGVPVETAFRAYREELFHGTDLGILGVWVDTDDLEDILDAVTE